MAWCSLRMYFHFAAGVLYWLAVPTVKHEQWQLGLSSSLSHAGADACSSALMAGAES